MSNLNLDVERRSRKKNITPRLKIETIDRLKKLADANDTSINKILEFIINEKFEEVS